MSAGRKSVYGWEPARYSRRDAPPCCFQSDARARAWLVRADLVRDLDGNVWWFGEVLDTSPRLRRWPRVYRRSQYVLASETKTHANRPQMANEKCDDGLYRLKTIQVRPVPANKWARTPRDMPSATSGHDVCLRGAALPTVVGGCSMSVRCSDITTRSAMRFVSSWSPKRSSVSVWRRTSL